MGLAFKASQAGQFAPIRQLSLGSSPQLCARVHGARVRVNSASVGASLPAGRVVPASERSQQQSSRLGAADANGAAAGGADSRPVPIGVVTAATADIVAPNAGEEITVTVRPAVKAQSRPPKPVFTPVPEDVIAEFEHKLEADLQTVGVTITAILGVIIFWRGVWSLLDHFVGDSVVGDICCVIVGLTIVLYIRLSGMKIASFWPPS